jgi:hypothetical protein
VGTAEGLMGGLYMGRDSVLIAFDLRDPDGVSRFHDERVAWRERADVEMLDEDHAVLIVWAGVSPQDERRAA